MKMKLTILLLFLLSIQLQAQQGGYALQFDGSNSVTAPLNVADFTAFSIEVWVKWEPATGNEIEFICGKAFEEMEIHTTAGNGIRFIPTTGVYFDAANVLPVGVWTHLAAIYQPSVPSANLYINGREVSITKLGAREIGEPLQNTSSDFHIGRRIVGETPYFFNGYIDELRVWDVARTDTEIRANMYKEIGTHPNLKVYYQMSNGTGTSLTDNSEYGNTGTLTNGPVWRASGCFAGSRQALDFDGTDDYISIPHDESLNMGTGNFTYEFWVKKSNSGTRYDIISKEDGGNENNDLSILISENNKAVFYTKETSINHTVTSIQTIPTGIWTHIAGVRDGTSLKVYVNGVLDNTSTGTLQNISNTNVMLLAANYNALGNTGFLNGQLDEVRIWNTARTEAELKESMMRTLAGNESNLVAYYRFDQYDGSTLYDMTSYANHGTLTNMAPSTAWVASSAFNTWLGGESSAWNNVANWSNGVPDATQSIGLYKWNLANITTYEASIAGNPVMNSLMISSGSAPTLSSGLMVNGNLLLEKDRDLNGQTVTLGPTGYLVEGNGYFSGATGMITTTRALNNITAQNVAGLGATLTSAADLGSTALTRTHSNQSSLPGGKSVLRSYDITPANNNGLNATLAYSYRDTELNDLTEAKLGLYSSADGGTTFTYRGGVLDANNNKITLTGLDGFSTWTAAACLNPTDGGTIGTAQTICSGVTPAELTQTAAPGGSPVGTLQYKWQASTTGSTADFADIADATATSYQPGNLTQTTWYKRLVKVDCETTWLESNVVAITVKPLLQYRMAQSGNWTTLASWQQYNGSDWVTATSYPGQITNDCASPLVSIQPDHQLEIQNGNYIDIPNLKVAGNGRLTVKSGGKIFVQDQLQLDQNAGGAIVVE